MIWARWLLGASVSAGLLFGLIAAASFTALLVSGSASRASLYVDVALLLGGTAATFFIVRATGTIAAEAQGGPGARWVLWTVLVITLACAIVGFVWFTLAAPHGRWDAWAIWNLRARFLFRDGASQWPAAVSPLLASSHPDYPLLLSAGIARTWQYIGADRPVVPAVVAAFFTFASVTILAPALAILRSPSQGLIGGVMLLATPGFITQGASQYADIPLGFFLLATIVLVSLHGRFESTRGLFLFLAGLTASLAAWTKNEGLLFLLALVIAGGIMRARLSGGRGQLREVAAFAGGLAPILLLILYFKLYLAPANDLVAGQGLTETTARLSELSRYAETAKAFTKEFLGLGIGHDSLGPVIAVLGVYLVSVGVEIEPSDRLVLHTGVITLALMLGGYFFVFVTTPNDLADHLNKALDRLLLQLWPSALFLYFLVACPLERPRG